MLSTFSMSITNQEVAEVMVAYVELKLSVTAGLLVTPVPMTAFPNAEFLFSGTNITIIAM